MKLTEKKMAEICKALGDPTRIKIIKLLSSRGKILCVGALAHELGITQPAVSQHLKVLKNIGLLEDTRVGCHVHYCVCGEILENYEKEFDELFAMLKKCCKSLCEDDSC
jgi:ArsR family transcriptional regulator